MGEDKRRDLEGRKERLFQRKQEGFDGNLGERMRREEEERDDIASREGDGKHHEG